MDYGNRPDETPKGKGWLGEIKRPDGDVMTEISIGVGINGKETLIPLIVPTLTKKEIDFLKNADPSSKEFFSKLPKSIMDKAYEHATKRMNENKSPFIDPEE
jgi:hypothetical protein